MRFRQSIKERGGSETSSIGARSRRGWADVARTLSRYELMGWLTGVQVREVDHKLRSRSETKKQLYTLMNVYRKRNGCGVGAPGKQRSAALRAAMRRETLRTVVPR